MRRSAKLLLVAVAAWLAAPAAHADDAAPGAAAEAAARHVADLFMQSCVQFAGNRDGLRQWAAKQGFQPLPPQGQDAFLNGIPGVAYDASDKDAKYVLISEDGGSCSAIAQTATGTAMVADLESLLRDAKVNFTVTADHDDRIEAALHDREYAASLDNRAWQMLVSFVNNPAGGQAMLTVNP